MTKKNSFTYFMLSFLGFFLLSESYMYALKSPRERWNYNKSEDMIEHHQRKVKINEKVIKSINNSEFGQNEKNMRKRKGSPRQRW